MRSVYLKIHNGGLSLLAKLGHYRWNDLKRSPNQKPLPAQEELPRYASMVPAQTFAVLRNADAKQDSQ